MNDKEIILNYLEENYKACRDCCGEDDEVNTIPAKEALDAAKRLFETHK